MNYSEAYQLGRKRLEAAFIEEAELDARLLLEEVCGTKRHDLFAHGDRALSEAEEKEYIDYLKKRAERIPLQYITGHQEFMGLDFLVNENVLIPRQDTEVLVEEVMKNLHDGMRLLDMCTGSGCILLSLLHYSNNCVGVGADISKKALLVAEENAKRLSISAHFIESDLFEQAEGQYDIIVSNPPYIPNAVIDGLLPEVKEHEPRNALSGGEDGYDFYKQIAAEAGEYLVRGGMLFLEIGCEQAEAVTRLLRKEGYGNIEVVKDFAGNDRVVYGTREVKECLIS